MQTRPFRIISTFILALALVACGSDASQPDDTESQTAIAAEPSAPAETLASADAPGKLQFLQCASCHAVEPQAPPKVGPNLHCVIGRQAGALEEFNYSTAFKQAANDGLTWDRETMLSFLEKPMALVPGNAMAFGGVPSAENREAIADYLQATCANDAE
ncbi:c-type cytochrome [Altererythrobacter sp. GH1-8]|uniref:c-type cytochrome n=1 Tax=Altererythrobacter sp. GH1-8 TaxID=3349333 RepID=UPI00374DF742